MLLKSEEVEMISVVVTIYNVEKYLKQCLDSILNQTFTDFEIQVLFFAAKHGRLDEESLRQDGAEAR